MILTSRGRFVLPCAVALFIVAPSLAQQCDPNYYFDCGTDCCPYPEPGYPPTVGCYSLDPSVVFGVNPHWITGAPLDKAVGMNMRWVRLDLNWNAVEQTKGIYSWGGTDSIVSAANSRNLHILGLLHGTPGWASSNGQHTGWPKDAEAEQHWVAFVQAIAQRYPSITYWEPWNEPNRSDFWVGSVQQYYLLILKPASDALRALGRKVVAPTLSDNPGSTIDEPSFFGQLHTFGATAAVDVISQNHYYEDSSYASLRSKWNWRFNMYNANGFTSQPVLVTETGRKSSVSGGESGEAIYLVRQLYYRMGAPRITNTFIYELEDGGGAYGVLTASGQPKLPYYYLRDIYIPACQCIDYPWCQ